MSDATLEFDRMLNPGFCGVIASALVEGSSSGLPLVAVYVLVPMVLQRRTAEQIYKSRARGLIDFVHKNPDIIIGLDRWISITKENTRAGIAVALLRDALRFNPQTRVLVATEAIKNARLRLQELLTDEDNRRVSVSLKLGEWAGALNVALICDALAVRPTWRLSQGPSVTESPTTRVESNL